MCLGDLGVVTGFVPERAGRDVVVVDTVRGAVEATILLAPHTRRGDHVVVHSGHVLQVLDADRANEAALLRRGSTRPPDQDTVHDHAVRHGAAPEH